MRLILTHEQADLDALASLLGAWVLDSKAHPVLPLRLNRNVRAFLTIYGPQFPFVERRDLPRESIEAITLVDTQSITTLKGMGAQTRIHVIDHHEPRDLPPDWKATIEPTGANTTLLIETIREQSHPLNVLQATLLLMGIYEDTGSLTYTRTTSRDLLAAAYLLEQGASLDIAQKFLNHPLSLAQQTLYEYLRDTAETHVIHGHTILVATGDARDMGEELSTIAHKLRDLLEPDGLILLIAIQGGVQLIARSTNDHVNVGGIASYFGGGGHRRAAAAIVKQGEPDHLLQELLRILPEHIEPAITVMQIMSSTPQLLTPGTTLEEAAQRMTRFGYEGYPVVENGTIIGLLTRRAVDRAISHKLNLPIRNLMNAGDISVQPNDSIEHLQRVMTDSGWGQIPVMEPSTRQIIGIVTRTDLLKTLAPQPAIPGYRNFSNLLEKLLPAGHLALLQIIASTAHEQHLALYVVGGFVRDLILESPSLDFDLVVEGDAITLAQALVQKYGGHLTTHARFGTAKWQLHNSNLHLEDVATFPLTSHLPNYVDLISARTEFYTHPTALPTVERGSIKLDLHRRDFTINTLALRLDGHHFGELHDYWGGYNDLSQGIIRVLHSISFLDDPTRMLRGVRFEQRFGFQIDPRTLDLIQTALSPQEGSGATLLERVSGDRIRHELDHILDEPNAAEMLGRLDELGLLKAIHVDLPWHDHIKGLITHLPEQPPGPDWGFDAVVKGIPAERGVAYSAWLAHLHPDKIRSISKRLKLPQFLETIILEVQGLVEKFPDVCKHHSAPSTITAQLEKVPWLGVYSYYVICRDQALRECIDRYIINWQHIYPETDGNSLKELGIKPGPAYSEILSALRAAWLDGKVSSFHEEMLFLIDLVESYRG